MLDNVVSYVRETPWAILPSKMEIIEDIIARRAAGERLSEEEIYARVGASKNGDTKVVRAGAVQVIPIFGTIIPRASLFSEMSGGTSLQTFKAQFQEALADEEISAIVLDVNSPGGSTDLVAETAQLILEGRDVKPIYAVADTLMCSAAYWLASQANEIFSTPSGMVGSIGVIATHMDYSANLEKVGVKPTLITFGKAKGAGSPYFALSDDAKSEIQRRVDDMGDMFVSAVAEGRSTSVDTVMEKYGQGKVFTPRDALKAGMIDGIATLAQVVARAANPSGEPGSIGALMSGVSLTAEVEAARAAVSSVLDRVSSLAEVREGRITAAKRESLTACSGAFREASEKLDELLATNPNVNSDGQQAEILRERARLEQLRLTSLEG